MQVTKDSFYHGEQLASQRCVDLIHGMVKEPKTLALLMGHTHVPMTATWSRLTDKPDWCRLERPGQPVTWHNNSRGYIL